MLIPDEQFYKDVEDLRRADPNGVHSTSDLERVAYKHLLRRKIENLILTQDSIRDVLETIVELLP